MINKMQLCRIIYYSIVPWLLYMFRAMFSLIIKSILTVITASGFIHVCRCRLLSWLSRNCKWYDIIWHIISHHITSRHISYHICDMLWYIRYDMMWCAVMWYDDIWYDTIWYMIWYAVSSHSFIRKRNVDRRVKR